MAKIREESITVTVSTMVRGDDNDAATVFDHEIIATLEEAVAALIGGGHMVEIVTNDTTD